MSWTKPVRDMTSLQVRKITVASVWKDPEGGHESKNTNEIEKAVNL